MRKDLFLQVLYEVPGIKNRLELADLANVAMTCRGAQLATQDSYTYRNEVEGYQRLWERGPVPMGISWKAMCHGMRISHGMPYQPRCQLDYNHEHLFHIWLNPTYYGPRPPRQALPERPMPPPFSWSVFGAALVQKTKAKVKRDKFILAGVLACFFFCKSRELQQCLPLL